jgi:hypothetical protein
MSISKNKSTPGSEAREAGEKPGYPCWSWETSRCGCMIGLAGLLVVCFKRQVRPAEVASATINRLPGHCPRGLAARPHSQRPILGDLWCAVCCTITPAANPGSRRDYFCYPPCVPQSSCIFASRNHRIAHTPPTMLPRHTRIRTHTETHCPSDALSKMLAPPGSTGSRWTGPF